MGKCRAGAGGRTAVGIAAALAIMALPAVAGANHTGVQEPNAGVVGSDYFRQLRPATVRGVFRYDVALGGSKDRTRLDMWLDNVRTAGAEPFVVLGAIKRKGKPSQVPHRHLRYEHAFDAFLDAYGPNSPNSSRRVTFIGAWNEPNFADTRVPAGLAAAFYNHANERCGGGSLCTVVAGELAGGRRKGQRRFVKTYVRRIHPTTRTTFGVHTYGDVRRFQICNKPRREFDRSARRKLARDCGRDGKGRSTRELGFFRELVPRARLWVTETGAFLRIRKYGKVRRFTQYEHCRAVSFIQGFRGRYGRIDRVYYYRFAGHATKPLLDSGLLTPSGKRRKAFFNMGPEHKVCRKKAAAAFAQPTAWISGHGVGSEDRLMADVTGDGRADAVVYFDEDGSWHVAASTGSAFGPPSEWIRGHGIGSHKRMLGDVTGDGKADAVVFFHGPGEYQGTWWVSPSSGSSFAPFSRWIAGHGAGADKIALSDVTGDGKADAIAFVRETGTWRVAPSTGTAFSTPSEWIAGHGIGSSEQSLDDVTGDNFADAVVFAGQDGTWMAAPSTGAGFGTPARWISGHGAGSTTQFVADVNGDDAGDAVAFYKDSGAWFVAPATP